MLDICEINAVLSFSVSFNTFEYTVATVPCATLLKGSEIVCRMYIYFLTHIYIQVNAYIM